MSYEFQITVDLKVLSNYNLMALTQYLQYQNSTEVDCENYIEAITINFIDTQEQFFKFISRLTEELELHNILKYKNDFIYLLNFNNINQHRFFDEENLAQAIHYIKRMKNFLTMKLEIDKELNKKAENSPTRSRHIRKISSDLILTIKSKSNSALSVSVNEPVIIGAIWNYINDSLIKLHTDSSTNPYLRDAFKDKEVNLDILEKTQRSLRFKRGSYFKKTLAELCLDITQFLNDHNIYNGDGKLSNKQAQLIFELLHLFKYIDNSKIKSTAEDYIRALLNNHKLL